MCRFLCVGVFSLSEVPEWGLGSSAVFFVCKLVLFLAVVVVVV